MNAVLSTVNFFFFFSSRRRHTRFKCDWSSDVCSSDLVAQWRRYLLEVLGCYRHAGGMRMPTISDVSIINWNTTEAKPVPSGLERTICSEGLCGSKTLTVYQRTVLEGRQFDVNARDDYHLVYVVEAPKEGIITFNGKSHAAEDAAGVL